MAHRNLRLYKPSFVETGINVVMAASRLPVIVGRDPAIWRVAARRLVPCFPRIGAEAYGCGGFAVAHYRGNKQRGLF